MLSTPEPGPSDPVPADGETERDATPPGPADRLDPVARAVAFAEVLASSSLGTPDARRHRLAGRRELERWERPGPGRAGGRCGDISPAADLRIAEELDRRGYTFESEMFSRRSAGAITHLAVLLEAKGFASESVELYAHAAAAADVTSIWRLTALSAQLDGPARATGLVRAAGSVMSESDRRSAGRCLRQMSRRREDPDPDLTSLVGLLDEQPVGSVFALGSILLGMSGRADLARLAYCSAFARGHAPAAVALLALAGGSGQFGPAARTVLDECPGLLVAETTGPVRALRGLERFAGALRCDLGDRCTFAALVELARSARTRRARSQAQQRALVAVRILTWLRGAVLLGTGRTTRQAVHTVAAAVSAQFVDGMRADVPGTALLVSAWSTGQKMLDRVGRGTTASRPGADAGEVPARSGIALRAERVLATLPPVQRDVVVLRVAGICDDDAAAVLGMTDRRPVADVYAGGVARMWNGQRGEDAVDHALWQEVEDCFPDPTHRFWTTAGRGL